MTPLYPLGRLFVHNMCAKKLWHTYVGHGSEYPVDAFVRAVQLFLTGTLHMTEEDVGVLLPASSVDALGRAIDLDGNGKARVVAVGVHAVCLLCVCVTVVVTRYCDPVLSSPLCALRRCR